MFACDFRKIVGNQAALKIGGRPFTPTCVLLFDLLDTKGGDLSDKR